VVEPAVGGGLQGLVEALQRDARGELAVLREAIALIYRHRVSPGKLGADPACTSS